MPGPLPFRIVKPLEQPWWKDDVTVELRARDVYLRETSTGHMAIDRCASDQEHLQALTPEGFERRRCRLLFSDLVPGAWLGKRGKLRVTINFEPEGAE